MVFGDVQVLRKTFRNSFNTLNKLSECAVSTKIQNAYRLFTGSKILKNKNKMITYTLPTTCQNYISESIMDILYVYYVKFVAH
jgi:hypothetical protein